MYWPFFSVPSVPAPDSATPRAAEAASREAAPRRPEKPRYAISEKAEARKKGEMSR